MNNREVFDMKKHKNNKRGQIAVEAAIAFTITLVFLASVVSAIDFYRTDILMRRSVEQTCEKMSLLYPVSVPASDFMSAAINAFPDLGIGNTKGAEVTHHKGPDPSGCVFPHYGRPDKECLHRKERRI